MSPNKPFTITSFAWRKDVEDRLASAGEEHHSDDDILEKLSSLAAFLQNHSLVVRQLTDSSNRVSKDFVLKSDDLTELGLLLIRKGYELWQRKAKTLNDVQPLEKVLAKIVAAEPGLTND